MDFDKQQADISFGTQNEVDCLPLFRNKWDTKLCRTNTYSYVDYISPKTYVEIKSRRCNHNTYETIMIGKNKVEFCLKSHRSCYLVWKFEDGIYYWKVNRKDLDDGNVFYAMGGRNDRGVDERKEVAYVKRELLQAF